MFEARILYQNKKMKLKNMIDILNSLLVPTDLVIVIDEMINRTLFVCKKMKICYSRYCEKWNNHQTTTKFDLLNEELKKSLVRFESKVVHYEHNNHITYNINNIIHNII